jgi:hypothetical protein
VITESVYEDLYELNAKEDELQVQLQTLVHVTNPVRK